MDQNKTYIGDEGVIQKQDFFGKAIIIISSLVSVALIVIGLLAIFNP